MNILDESFNEKKVNKSEKTAKRVIIALIILLVLGIIGILIAMSTIEQSTLKVYFPSLFAASDFSVTTGALIISKYLVSFII